MLLILRQLSGLTKLGLASVTIDVASLDRARLRPFPNIRSLTLFNITCEAVKTLPDIVSDLFPNLEQLSVSFYSEVPKLFPSRHYH